MDKLSLKLIIYLKIINMESEKDKEIKLLKEEIKELKEQLSKYTNPERTKKYQSRNKEKIQEYQKEYQKKYYEKKKKDIQKNEN